MSLGQAGCGIIACYNALYGCGIDASLSELIALAEERKYFWGFGKDTVEYLIKNTPEDDPIHKAMVKIQERGADNHTGFGINPLKINSILKTYVVSCTRKTNRSEFLTSLKNAINKGDKKRFIVDYWVIDKTGEEFEIYSQHYIYIETSGSKRDDKVKVYNYGSYDTNARTMKYQDISNLLSNQGINVFIIAYEVKG